MERFHQSFFFYLLPEPHRYVSIGLYMPPFCCLLFGPLITAVMLWAITGDPSIIHGPREARETKNEKTKEKKEKAKEAQGDSESKDGKGEVKARRGERESGNENGKDRESKDDEKEGEIIGGKSEETEPVIDESTLRDKVGEPRLLSFTLLGNLYVARQP